MSHKGLHDTGILTYNILNSPVLQLKHFSNLLCGLSCPGLRRPPLLEEHHPVTSSPLDATSTQSNCYSPAQPLMYVFNWFLLHDLSVTRWVNPIMSGGKSVCFCFLVGLWPRSFVFPLLVLVAKRKSGRGICGSSCFWFFRCCCLCCWWIDR